MITLRDVSKYDENIYAIWLKDSLLTAFLSRLCPYNSRLSDYDKSSIFWFIIEADTRDIGSVWLERELEEKDTVVLGIFISEEQYRGKGIGSYAINEAIKISKKRMHFGKIKLNVRKSNVSAIKCYEKLGFLICGEGQKTNFGESVIDYYKMKLYCGK